MIVIGVLLMISAGAVLALAKPLNANWQAMLVRLRGAGFSRPPFGTRFIASPEGLRAMWIVGISGLAVGAILVVLGALS